MSVDTKRKGQYELFETTQQHRILVLDGQDYYALVSTSQGQLLVLSDADHEKARMLHQGNYVLFTPHNEPNMRDDMDHLELQDGKSKYQTYILPHGLPTGRDKQKKIVETGDYMRAEQIKQL